MYRLFEYNIPSSAPLSMSYVCKSKIPKDDGTGVNMQVALLSVYLNKIPT